MPVGRPNPNDLWPAAHDRAGGSAGSSSGQLSAQPIDDDAERRRRELDAAIEEELRRIVTKTSQERSGSGRPAEEAKKAAPSRSRRSRLPWIMALAVVILALSGMIYQVLRKSETTEPTLAANPAGLGLKVEMKKNTVQVSWDKNAPLIASAKRATLSIKDGQRQNDLTLGADLLARGSLNYYHKTKDITFHLQVVADGNRTTSEVVQLPGGAALPASVSVNLGRERVSPVASSENSKAAGSQAPPVPPQVPSNKGTNTGTIKGVAGLVHQRVPNTQLSPRAISVRPLEEREPAATEMNSTDLTTSTRAGVPQTWKLVVEYLGLKPLVSAQPAATLPSNSPSMEEFSRAEDAGTLKSQAVTPPSDEATPSLSRQTAKDVSLADETPVHDSALQDPVVAQTQAAGTDSAFPSVIQCPENSKVREVPFVTGRPDRKTVGCGEPVTIIRQFGDWVRIKTRDGFEGHILRRFVK